MPLLPLEPFLFPEDLLSNAAHRAGDAARWWALHTRPRAEKTLARKFLGRSLPFFLPLYKRQWRNRGRLQCSHVPLFPSYLFLFGDDQKRVEALTTNLIVRSIAVADQDQLHTDLARVHHLITADAPLTPEDRLQPGRQVEIIRGPLTGLVGKVLRRGKKLTFHVEVQLLQRGVSVEIEGWMIEPVSEPHPATDGAHPR